MKEDDDAEAAILAGGRARRFGGRDKAFLEVGGEPILDRQIRVLSSLVPGVMIVAGDAGAGDVHRFSNRGARVVSDRVPGAGPLAGLDAALAAARAPRVLVVACDMPDLAAPPLELLLRRAREEEADIAIPRAGGQVQPLCAVYGARVAPIVRSRLRSGDLRAQDIPTAAEAAGLAVVRVGEAEVGAVDPDLRVFANLNTPEAWAGRRS